ncbi:MerR family transcriptional regulator [Paenibacillus terreus]|uniref:MerR family transcriptional regulator n=1 Tax=Paenibacillus terreus TaxID=1387834 RepID=UPI0035CD0B9D
MESTIQYTIGQIAEKTGLSIHTLRYYEKEGILPFIRRNASGIRVYEDMDIEWLKFVCALRETGMSIAQLKDFVQLALQGDDTIDERLEILNHQRQKIEAQVETLMGYMDRINRKADLYHQIKSGALTSQPGQPGRPMPKG